MRTVPISEITIPEDRQRKENKSSKELHTLKRGIASKGLLHAPVITASKSLVAGERRLLALAELHKDSVIIYYDGEQIPLDHAPFTFVSELTEDDLEEAELEENVLRSDLTWPEESAAKLRIHELRKKKNPEQTAIDTAKEISAVNGNAVVTEAHELTMARTVQAHMTSPAVKTAKTLRKAYDTVMRQKEANLLRDLSKISKKDSKHQILLGDCRTLMKTLPKNSFDLILSDPPYGINADKTSADTGHHYDDSKDAAMELYADILRRGFHLLKPQGIIFLFCDIEHFITIRTIAEQQAFSTFRTPIIWHKGEGGNAPWGRRGFTRTYETVLFAVKGQKSLILGGGPDVRLVARSTKATKQHGAEKPPELLRWLMEISTSKGDSVLDPCCGSGPIIPAAKGLDLSITAIELNEEYHAKAVARLTQEEEEVESIVARPVTLADIEEDVLG